MNKGFQFSKGRTLIRHLVLFVGVLSFTSLCPATGTNTEKKATTTSASSTISNSKINLESLPKVGLLNAKLKSPAELKGKIVLVDFWASWCEPCKESLPFYQDLQNKNSNLEIILINEDSEKKLGEDFLKEKKITIPSRYDTGNQLAKNWDMEALPMMFIFDKNSKFSKSIRGFSKAKEQQLIKIIDELK